MDFEIGRIQRNTSSSGSRFILPESTRNAIPTESLDESEDQNESSQTSTEYMTERYMKEQVAGLESNDSRKLQTLSTVISSPCPVETSVLLSNYKTLSPNRRHGVFFGCPKVHISLWNVVNQNWSQIKAEEIRLSLGNKKTALEVGHRMRSNRDNNGKNKSLILASLVWKTKKQDAERNVYLAKRDYKAKSSRSGVTERYKPTFYFQIFDAGELGKILDEDAPENAWQELATGFDSLYTAHREAARILTSQHQSSTGTWIRLEAHSHRSDREIPMQIFNNKKARYKFVSSTELPCGGLAPFMTEPDPPEVDADIGNDLGTSFTETKPNIEPFDEESVFSPIFERPPQQTSTSCQSKDIESLPQVETSPRCQIQHFQNSVEVNTLEQEKRLISDRLQDIEQELKLLREKHTLGKRLEEINARIVALRVPESLLDI